MQILVASQNTLIRNGIQHILEESVEQITPFSCETVDKFTTYLQRQRPDILFFEKSNRSIYTHDVLRIIRRQFPSMKIILIANLENASELVETFEMGIEAFMTYECDQDEIQKSIANVMNGEKFYCQKVLARILEIQQPKVGSCKAVQLTDRETEIARYIAEGNTNKQIAAMLCISPHTVHTHRKSLMKKIGVNSATDVARYAFNEGLIS